MNKDEPRKLWLQVYDEEGNYMDPEWRTFSADERVNPTDLCYVRWGKTNILCIERDAALARAEAAETERNRLQRELSAAVTRVAELEADYAEENRLHAEAEARAAELEGVNGEFYRLGAGGDPAP